jgi:formylmethanofuran:tetrahydromethanopterin formyltransferase
LREVVSESKVPSEAKSVYEIVINGLDLEAVKKAMGEGIRAAIVEMLLLRLLLARFLRINANL